LSSIGFLMADFRCSLHRAESDYMDSSDPDVGQDLAVRMAELARAMAAPRTLEQILDDVTAAAVELVPGADAAGVLLVKRGGDFESLSDTDGLVAQLDKLQQDFREGPCAEAALEETVVRSDDLRGESRWPRYAPAAVKLGVLSGLSFKLYTAERTAGALSLFGFQPGVWDTDAETTGAVLAAHAAAAILATRHGEQMQTALSTRDRIGQAKGIIMERYGVDDVRAFEMLRVISRESHTKLADVAQRVIDTRDNN
jgi:GAF domain-containing protein